MQLLVVLVFRVVLRLTRLHPYKRVYPKSLVKELLLFLVAGPALAFVGAVVWALDASSVLPVLGFLAELLRTVRRHFFAKLRRLRKDGVAVTLAARKAFQDLGLRLTVAVTAAVVTA